MPHTVSYGGDDLHTMPYVETTCARPSEASAANAARLAVGLDRPPGEEMDRFLRVHEGRPSHAEALASLARHGRVNGRRRALAHLFAKQAARIPYPDDILFVERDWYAWRALDELAIAGYWVGEYEESEQCCERLLEGGKLPEDQRDRVTRNLEFARSGLGGRKRVGA
ncbi:hypothetical protein AB0903_11785 [Streptomyces sp. NPDC048389]|uniref:hypothetical protein n=1 Tax=Streptomyces sp. NPDC048389 TaxID=3154622 RepID=UPI003456709B